MRRFVVVLGVGAAIVVGAIAVPATGQMAPPAVTVSANLSLGPLPAGKHDGPKSVRLRAMFDVDTGGDETITGGRLYLPRGLSLQGDEVPSCPLARLNRVGPSGCPRKSLVGVGGTEKGSGSPNPVSVRFVNGGLEKLYAYTTAFRPTLTKEPFLFRLSQPEQGRWSHMVDFRAPERIILAIVEGYPGAEAFFNSFRFGIGRRPTGSTFLVAKRGCRKGYMPFKLALFLFHDTTDVRSEVSYAGRIECTGPGR